jgi:flagellar motor switch protein FliM
MSTAARELRADAPVRGGASFVENLAFSIDRVPGVAGVLDLFCIEASPALAPLLAQSVSVQREAPSACDLRQFVGRRLGEIGAVLYCEELDSRVLIVFGQDGADFIVNTAFGWPGGDGPISDVAEAQPRTPSAIEANLVRHAALALGGALEGAFQQSAHARFVLERCAPITSQDAVARRDIGMVVANVVLSSSKEAGSISLALPQPLLQALKHELGERPSDPAAADPRWSRQIEAGMARANLQVSAVLEDIEMTLNDVASFHVGRTIELRGGSDGRVRLQSAGRAIFRGRIEEEEGQYRVVVDEPVVEEELWLRDEPS